jgi:hypothetical protein
MAGKRKISEDLYINGKLNLTDSSNILRSVIDNSDGTVYFGDPNTDNSWRIIAINNEISFEERMSGTWVSHAKIGSDTTGTDSPIVYGGSYTVNPSSTTNIPIGKSTVDRKIKIGYVAERSGEFKSGDIDILNTGTTLIYDSSVIETLPIGMTLDFQIDSQTHIINIICTADGSDANNLTFKFKDILRIEV